MDESSGPDGGGGAARPVRGRRRARSVRSAVRKAIKAARDGDRITAYDEPAAALAEMVALQLDDAADAGRAGEVVRLTKSLRDLLDDLPLRPERTPGDHGDGSGDSAAGADPVDRELADLVGSGPEVGDAAHA